MPEHKCAEEAVIVNGRWKCDICGADLGPAPPPEPGPSEKLIQCFELGARIHDHVEDMLNEIEELDEAKDDERQMATTARTAYEQLEFKLDQEIGQAKVNGCLPTEVEELYVGIPGLGPRGGDTRQAREKLYALSVKLGDPPGLRNLRRARDFANRPRPEERK
jgi:hypothetical protein